MARADFGRNMVWIASAPRSTIGLSILAVLVLTANSEGQLRVVTYNTDGAAFISSSVTGNGPTDRVDTILKAIGEEIGNDGQGHSDGIAKPIDLLMLQEQNLPAAGAGGNPQNASPTTQTILSMLNTAYAGQGVTYAMSNRTGTSDGAGTQTLIYRAQTVQLIADTAFGYVGQDRQTARFQLRPVGYTSAADFYVYNSHYKASLDSSPPGTNATKRLNEADAIRLNSD